jgi:hypothetical protein
VQIVSLENDNYRDKVVEEISDGNFWGKVTATTLENGSKLV